MLNKIYKWIHTNEWLILVCGAVILLRIPSWFEPNWYGDEAIYLTIGQAINKGVRLYSQIHDNKPPFLYLVSTLANGNLFWFKIAATLSALSTVVVFADLAKKITAKKTAACLATILFAFAISWPKLEGNIANAELFFLLPTVGAVNILLKKDLSAKRLLTGGVVLGIAALFKMPAILELAIWPLLWLVTTERKWFKNSLWLAAGACLPICISVAYYFVSGSLDDYLRAAWFQNIPYLASWKPADTSTGIYALKNRAAILAAIWAVVFGLSRRWGKNGTLIAAWTSVALFSALLSGRPYPHYLLQAVPGAVLAITAIIFDKPRVKIIQAVLLGVSGAAVAVFNFYNYPVTDYYKNFLDWTAGTKADESYLTWFGDQNRLNYQIAGWVKSMTQENDSIFIWGDVPMIYALADRLPASKYIVKYHIKDFKAETYTLEQLAEGKPAVVVSYGNENEFPGFESWLSTNYRPERKIGGVVIYNREK